MIANNVEQTNLLKQGVKEWKEKDLISKIKIKAQLKKLKKDSSKSILLINHSNVSDLSGMRSQSNLNFSDVNKIE